MTFTSDVNKFLRTHKDSIKDEDAPAVGALKYLAKHMDTKEMSANLISQYRQIYQNLLKKVQAQETPTEEDDGLIS